MGEGKVGGGEGGGGGEKGPPRLSVTETLELPNFGYMTTSTI